MDGKSLSFCLLVKRKLVLAGQDYRELLAHHAWNCSEEELLRQSAGLHHVMTEDVVWTATSSSIAPRQPLGGHKPMMTWSVTSTTSCEALNRTWSTSSESPPRTRLESARSRPVQNRPKAPKNQLVKTSSTGVDGVMLS